MKPDQNCLIRPMVLSLLLLAALLLPPGAQAQGASDYPVRPITLVVPFAAGGPVDLIARRAADALSKEIKQSVVVENKPGGGGAIAFSYVAHAKPSGYTLVSVDMSFAVLAHFQSHTGFDPLTAAAWHLRSDDDSVRIRVVHSRSGAALE